jgi:RNA polymerase sigma-70 factor (ECF subfamily)
MPRSPQRPPDPAPEVLAFDRVFADHATLVWRALRRLGVTSTDIEDICQDVFLTISRRLQTFEGRSAISTWVYGICVHAALAYHRKRRRRPEEPTHELPDIGVDPPQLHGLERSQALAIADSVLDALDDDKRVVFVLFEIEEMPMREVADAIGCPLQTAFTRLYAARRQFEAAICRAKAQGRIA